MKKITLILGGIRSGKSYFAETRAEYYSNKPVYIATALGLDKEMQSRILAHQKRRGNGYETIEAPYDITGPLKKLKNRTVLVDCLTLNLSNRLLATSEYMELEELIETDEDYLEEIHKIICKNKLNIIFVSNEVGFSPVTPNKLGRFFQDLQGRWNRIMASYADEVYVIHAGIPSLQKKQSLFPFKIAAPSYLIPTGYIENVSYLVGKVDDVQLLLFDSIPDDPLFHNDTIRTLNFLAQGANMTYSAHMPVRPKIFDQFEQRIESTYSIIQKVLPLSISCFTFHYDLPDGKKWNSLTEKEITEIDELYIRFFLKIRERFPQVNLALENTETPLSALDSVVQKTGISYCMDIGHLLVQGWDISEIRPRLKNTSVIHLHGWETMESKKIDHRVILYNRDIFQMLEEFKGILTIENYHPIYFEKSMSVLREYF